MIPNNAPYGALIRFGIVLAVIAMLVIGSCRHGQRLERADHEQTKAKHAEVLAGIAEKTRVAAEKAAAVRGAFDAAALAAQAAHALEVSDAFERGRVAAAGIRDGAVSVRTVWRDRECPAADAGQGAGPAGGDQAFPASRADAIGRVLGLGWAWDADYALAVRRLTEAQQLLNACYEQPAP